MLLTSHGSQAFSPHLFLLLIMGKITKKKKGHLAHGSRCHTFQCPLTHCFTDLHHRGGSEVKDINAACSIRAGATLGSLSWQQGPRVGRNSHKEKQVPCPSPADGQHWRAASPASNPPSLSGSLCCGPSRSVCSLGLTHAGQLSTNTGGRET